MNLREVEKIYNPPHPHMVGDGFRVHNFIPGIPELSMSRMDPYIMLDYNSKFNFPASNTPKGVGVHPHRGFETITIAYHGRIAHHDSYGNSGIIHEGEVQWMTAASGILHKEYHEEEFSKSGGDFQMVQLWLNLPAKYKMTEPKYQNITKESIPKILTSNNQVEIELIAGNFLEHKGPAYTFTPVNLMNIKLNAGAEIDLNYPEDFNTCMLVIEGEIVINNLEKAKLDQLVLMKNHGQNFSIKSEQASTILLLSAQPINEPIASHGPFVMNTREELIQAFNDFQEGKFGVLVD
ncbi:MAG: pirin family protein [Saprospiraceae bacterium]